MITRRRTDFSLFPIIGRYWLVLATALCYAQDERRFHVFNCRFGLVARDTDAGMGACISSRFEHRLKSVLPRRTDFSLFTIIGRYWLVLATALCYAQDERRFHVFNCRFGLVARDTDAGMGACISWRFEHRLKSVLPRRTDFSLFTIIGRYWLVLETASCYAQDQRRSHVFNCRFGLVARDTDAGMGAYISWILEHRLKSVLPRRM